MRLLVSACLLGENCRYDGVVRESIFPYLQAMGITPVGVCPEVLGGLSVPRLPSEIKGGGGKGVWSFDSVVVNKEGKDVTDAFMIGAVRTLLIAIKEGIRFAVLKSKSPSCGVHEIYDGSFSGRLVKGMGVSAYLLSVNGIKIIDEIELKSKIQMGFSALFPNYPL